MSTTLDNNRLNLTQFLSIPSAGGATSQAGGYSSFSSKQNTLSYSTLQTLHTCPRRFILDKYSPNRTSNVDFAMGHAVGAGVQSYLLDKDLDRALMYADCAWDLHYSEDNVKKKKGIDYAFRAIELFPLFASEEFADWSVLTLPNGRPAIETTFSLQLGDYWFSSHVDIILQHCVTKQVRVFEIKTSGFSSIAPELYANSSQALGYMAFVHKLFPEVTDLEVDYLVYSCPNMEWNFLPFVKTEGQIHDWVTDLLLDKSRVAQFFEMDYFPKYGSGCLNFNRTCPHFGSCDFPPLTELARVEHISEVETPDYTFQIQDFLPQDNTQT